MSTGPTQDQQYKPGDVVNGHVLTDQGQWVPTGHAPPVPGQYQGQPGAAGQYQSQPTQPQPHGIQPGADQQGATAQQGLKPTKPLWKRWWFILIAAIVLIVVFSNLASGGEDPGDERDPAAIDEPVEEALSEEAAAAEAEAAAQAEKDAAEAAEKAAEEAAAAEAAAAEAAAEEAARGTLSQQNAFSKAVDYLAFAAFSRSGLIHQLEFEGFPTADAEFAVARLETSSGVDWNTQAAEKAADYLSFSSFSRSGLIDQLLFEGFTPEQAEFGVSQTGL